MSKMLRTVLAGFVILATMTACESLQAQTTFPPIYFAGVVGETDIMRTVEGDRVTFTGACPNFFSVFQSQRFPGYEVTGSAVLPDDLYSSLQVQPFQAPTEPAFFTWTLDYRTPTGSPHGIPAGTGDATIVIFSTAVHRDAFLYYVAQREAAATEEDYLYFETLAAYEFWIGQEEEGVALYLYYTGLATYFRDTALDPQEGDFYYYYYYGLGAYFYFGSIGDFESAAVSWFYYYGLAIEALRE